MLITLEPQHARQLHINFKHSTGIKIMKPIYLLVNIFMIGNDTLDIHIFSTVEQIRKTNNGADLEARNLKDLTNDFLSDRIRYRINGGKLLNKNNLNAVFYYINQKIVNKKCPCQFSNATSIYPKIFH